MFIFFFYYNFVNNFFLLSQYISKKKAFVLLEDGTIFHGKSIGLDGTAYGELCFNTGMTGYQEIFTDPSYNGQLMVMTNAHIGNYGANFKEVESDSIKIAGLICKNFSYNFSRHRESTSLYEFLSSNSIVSISDVDTRALVSYIRDNGAMNAVITTESIKSIDKIKAKLLKTPSMNGLELASKVSTEKPYYFRNEKAKYRIAVLDLGVKRNILRKLTRAGCKVKVIPAKTPAEDVLAEKPDGVFLSNGPGDPAAVTYAIKNVKALMGKVPVFGICLGHQILSLALNATTYKLRFGHHGGNQPIMDSKSGKVEITSQNHGFAVTQNSLQGNVEITSTNLNDDTVEGIRHKDWPIFSVQYHPEASPGPHDSDYLFDKFAGLMKAAN